MIRTVGGALVGVPIYGPRGFAGVTARRAAAGERKDVEYDDAGVPIAFRIWKAGANVTDHGVHVFSPASAERLMAQQTARGNLYSIDVDHMSLSNEAPPEFHKAVGWHKLAVRDGEKGPELWAVEVQWTDTVRAGLAKDPPEWRYFSPAYDVAKDTGEISGYLNTAITNQPATWSVTALATRSIRSIIRKEDGKWNVYSEDGKKHLGGPYASKDEALARLRQVERFKEQTAMTKEEMRAALLAWAGDDGDKMKQAESQLAAMFPDGDDDKKEETRAAEDRPSEAPEEKKTEKRAAEEPPEEEPKTAAKAATAAFLARIEELEREAATRRSADEKREREEIFASRPDVSEGTKKILAAEKPARIRELFATLPAPATKPRPNTVANVQGIVRGQGQGGADELSGVSRVSAHAELLDEQMGFAKSKPPVRLERNSLVCSVMTPSQARAHLKKHAARLGAEEN